jgi:hypothetical protein
MAGLTEYFLPDELVRTDSVERRRASLAIRAVFTALIWAPIVGILYWMAGSHDAVIVLSIGSAAVSLTPFLLKWTRRMDIAGSYLLVTVTAMLVGLCFLFGGVESPSLTWILLVPVFAVLFQGIREGAIWLGVVVLCWAGIAALDFTGYPFQTQLDPAMLGWLRVVEAVGLSFIVFGAFFLQDRLQSWLIDTARARQSETSLVLETAPDGILTVDPTGVVQSTNEAAADLFDRGSDDIVGHHVHDLISSLEPDRLLRGDGTDREHVGVRDDGSTFPVEVAYGVFDGETREGAVLVFRDITARKNAEHELREARDKAVEASRTKSEFLANMSHELRTPLNAVIGYSEMLIDELEAPAGFGSPDQAFVDRHLPDLNRIRVAGKHLLALINDILDLSKIEAGKMTTHVELIDIRDLLDSVVGTIQPLADKNGNALDLEIGEGVQFIRSDVTKLRQILFNLLSNACKFTHEGTVELDVWRDEAAGQIYFEVTDDGIGMSPEQVELVFDAFTQADSSTTRKFGGTGLGLTITNHFTSLLGGDIRLESVEDQGTTFTVRLDADLDGAGEVQPLPTLEGEQSLGAERSFVEPSALNEDVVLVIDDDPTMRDLLQRVLERDGFHVATAASGSEGLVLAEQLQPLAITLDVMMSSMDGWTLLSKLKEHPELCEIPVVMVTIVSETSRGYALGADDYLVKPVDRHQLVNVMERYRSDWAGQRGELLLVEDDEPTRALVRRTLQKDGWAVTEATDGEDGLEKLDTLEPDLVVLDLMMPNMDGFEFLQELRGHTRYADIPVVVVTAKELTPAEETELRAGVSEILTKGGSDQPRLLEEIRSEVMRVAAAPALGREASSG